MRRDRFRVTNCPAGTTIEETPGGYIWTRVWDDIWYDESDHDTRTSRQMEDLISGGHGEVIIVDKQLTMQPIPSYDLEEGDYVVMRWGFWDEIDEPLFDPNSSQWIWRVAGWTNTGDGHWTVALDAPQNLLAMFGFSQFGEHIGYDFYPILLPVTADTVFHYVGKDDDGKDQDFKRWDGEWDWSGEYNFVDPPEVPE